MKMKSIKTNTNSEIELRTLSQQSHISYHCYVPKKIDSILVLIHGISRNAEEIIKAFKAYAEINNVMLIAPIFSKSFAKDYQRLGRIGKGPRADYQLLAIIKDCKQYANNNIQKFNLFGFSAGAQFAHRFAFAHPNLVNKVALVAAGWYTLPIKQLAYPQGIKLKHEFSDIEFIPARFLRLKYKVFIGSDDNKREPSLNKNRKIDSIQGLNRLQRASNWIEYMHLEFKKYGIINHINLEILDSVSHDFKQSVESAELPIKVMSWMQDA
jgi:pimeloyl-ACP methyl ester carboxylesterase